MELAPIALRACQVDPVRSQVLRSGGATEHLSPRELDLLLYLVANPGRIVPREELLAQVWHYAPTVVSRAVDTTVRRLREKVEADPQQPDHVLTAFGAGYRFVARMDEAPLPDAEEGDPFVGRQDEVRRLADVLRQAGGAAQIVGPPGAGKTRLARHLSHRMGPTLRGGTVLVDLTEARDLAGVALELALALGVESGGTGANVLRRASDALRARGGCLVVLDNCEGVGDAVGQAVAAIRPVAADARFLATSRQVLPEIAETLALGPLSQAESVALFEALGQRVRPDFLAAPVRSVVEELVERLERIPLAIALAAGRIHALSPKAILERLDDRFRVLASRGRADLRHPTLRAALDASWDLLSDPERRALLACSAFRGGFDRAAAGAVVDDPDTDAILSRLCAQSLLEPRGARIGGYAFVREYASERLAADPVAEDAVFARHADWFARTRPDQIAEILADHANLIAASERCIARGWASRVGPIAIAALEGIARRGPFEHGAALARGARDVPGLDPAVQVRLGIRQTALEQWTGTGDPLATQARVTALARAHGDPTLVADALRSAAVLARSRGDVLGAVASLQQALELARRTGDDGTGDDGTVSTMLTTLGATLRQVDRMDEARACWEEVAELARTGRAQDNLHVALGNLALLDRRAGRFDVARDRYRQALDHKLLEGDRRGECIARMGLANLDLDLGDWDAAIAENLRALELAVELGTREQEARLLGNLALCERGAGHADRARELFERAAETFDRLGETHPAAVARGNLAELDLTEGDADLAAATLVRSLAVLDAAHDRRGATELRCTLVEARLALGDAAEARRLVDGLEPRARTNHDPLLLARVLAVRGLVERAEGRDPAESLAEAERLSVGVRPSSELGQLLARVRSSSTPTGR